MTDFGRARLADWALDPGVTYLNHGTVGATPRRVLAAQRALRDEIERQPSRFLLRELTGTRVGGPRTQPPRMRVAAEQVAAFLGARGEDLVFVDNATTGINAVLRSFDLQAGDEILIHDLAYGAIANAARFAARNRGAAVSTVALPFPPGDPEELVSAFVAGLGPRTRLAIVDHVTSNTAVVMPVAEIARRCRERGVAVLVDGAHGPGALDLDIPALGVDWYAGNLHKWAWSPRSSGILWVSPERRDRLHPTVISWGLDQGPAMEFDLVGTRDPTPHLAAPAGIELMREYGVDAVRRWNHELAYGSARALAERWGTRFETPEALIGTMATLPLPARLGTGDEEAARLRDALLFEDAVEVQLHADRGGLWVRISAQIYNGKEDYERLGDAIDRRLGARR
jgi:isopenicillin-N epimerase